MKRTIQNLLTGILISLPIYFFASCQDLTGPQGEPGADGRDAVIAPDIGEALGAALAAKTGGGETPWLVKLSGLDLSDAYTARQIFHGVAAGIPEGGIDLDLSECTGAFYGYNPGIPSRDKARYTGLTLPDSLRDINDGESTVSGAFTGFTGLKKISASGLLRVGHCAFYGCTVLESLDLPAVTDIGELAFAPNSSTGTGAQFINNMVLTKVDLPAVKTIGDYAFFRCIAIEELVLPEVLSIGENAFAGYVDAQNHVLETVDLPSAEFLGSYAFASCPAISTINLPAAQEISAYAFAADVSDGMGSYFEGYTPNTSLVFVELPEAGIVVAAFAYCTALERAELPVAGSIGGALFKGCTALTTVNAPDASSVGKEAFDGCTSLVSLDLPKVTSVGASAFKGCTALTALTVPELTGIETAAFDGCTSLATLELLKVRSFGNKAFTNCTMLASLKLGPNVPTAGSIAASSAAANGIFLNTGTGDGASTAITIHVPVGSLSSYSTAAWQPSNVGATGWVDTAANGSPITWGTDHKQIIMATY